MAASYSTLQIVGSGVTADLLDGVNYALVEGGWAPAVAPLRVSALGGRGPYEDVEESITVDVLGASGAVCLANLAKLSALLDQATRWARGEDAGYVTLKCQPQGSDLAAAVQAVILGRTGGELVGLPASFNDHLMCYEISGVQLRFVRRGLWLQAAPDSAASSAGDVGTVQTATLAAGHAQRSPADVTIGPFEASAALNGSFLVAASATASIHVLEAETLTATAYTSVADVTNKARGGAVLRYTPTGTGAVATALATPTLNNFTARRMLALAVVRPNSATTIWRLRYTVMVAGGTTVDSAEVLVLPNGQVPAVVNLGVLVAPDDVLTWQLSVAASAASGTLDVDYIALVALDSPDTHVIALLKAPMNQIVASNLQVAARQYAYLTPFVGSTAGPNGFTAHSYQGDALLTMSGQALRTLLLAVGGSNAAHWRFTDAGGTVESLTMTVARANAYLTPQ